MRKRLRAKDEQWSEQLELNLKLGKIALRAEKWEKDRYKRSKAKERIDPRGIGRWNIGDYLNLYARGRNPVAIKEIH